MFHDRTSTELYEIRVDRWEEGLVMTLPLLEEMNKYPENHTLWLYGRNPLEDAPLLLVDDVVEGDLYRVTFRHICSSGAYWGTFPDSEVEENLNDLGASGLSYMEDVHQFIESATGLVGGWFNYHNFDKEHQHVVFVGAFHCFYARTGDEILCDEVRYMGSINPGAIGHLLV